MPSGARQPLRGRPRGAARAPGPPIRPAVRVGARRSTSTRKSSICGSAPLPKVGLESATDLINTAGQADIETVKIVAGSVAHRDSVLGPRSIGCAPPESACRGQTAKTDSLLQGDVRFPCDCDIAIVIWEFAVPRLSIASSIAAAPIDGDRDVARLQNRCSSTPDGFGLVCRSRLEVHESLDRH